MSWIEKLKTTYDNCKSDIGVEHKDEKGSLKYLLLPICHTSQNAQIEIVLDGDGKFLRANVVSKEGSQQTVLPATEGSAGRAGSKLAPLSLGDKLQYIAGDYEHFGGLKKIGFEKYISRLERWVESPYVIPEIDAVFKYLQQGKTISDLLDAKVLWRDLETNIFPQKWDGEKENKPKIFSVLQGDQLDSLVRFSVQIPGKKQSHLWKSNEVWQSWIKYYLANKVAEDNFDIEKEKNRHPPDKTVFCYVLGEELNYAGNHPAKIRNAGDGAKLISSNDTSGFTYRGRFLNDEQACTISYDISQKAHNALRWLIAKQGYRDGDLAVVAWSPEGIDIPAKLLNDTDDLFGDDGSDESGSKATSTDTAALTGQTLAQRIMGYSVKLGPTDGVVVMGMNSATPGRLSVSFYRELTGADFLKRLESWHTGCAWLQRYSKDKKFYGAPAPKDIAWAAFGKKLGTTGSIEVDDKIKRQTIERLLPCIVDGISIPIDIVRLLVRAATKRIIYEFWEWEKILGIACAVFSNSEKKRGYIMALERERTSRDYLFGRLLAVADCLEGFALSQAEKGRPTNAARMMQRFADHPCSTWRTIELALAPYRARLGYKATKYEKEIAEIMDTFVVDEFCKDTALSGEFLIGYYTQRSELTKKSEKQDDGGNN
ncbi:MAG: type I-C CRISPR-associated protein Cas8c/Csd1 [Desulfocapsa sp.]|nr:type I-C CRISPR-associated protein Cas8c/Csd1 [Desulfocapsa sp.]